MKIHHNTQDHFDDLLSGAIAADDRREVEAHLDTCPRCRTELESLRELMGAVRALPRAVEPPRELWPQVEARIGASMREGSDPTRVGVSERWFRRLFPRWRRFAPAALAVAAALLTVLRWPSGESALPLPAPSGGTDGAAYVAALVRGLEMECAGAERELGASANPFARPGGAVGGALESEIPRLDQAIAETRSALEASPEDAALLQMLTSRYQTKLSLLRQALRLAGEA